MKHFIALRISLNVRSMSHAFLLNGPKNEKRLKKEMKVLLGDLKKAIKKPRQKRT